MNTNPEMTAQTAWQNLEAAVADVYSGQGEGSLVLETVAAAVLLLYEFPPQEIISQAKTGKLPTRAAISWLVHEAKNLPEADTAKARALEKAWDRAYPGEELIHMPPPRD